MGEKQHLTHFKESVHGLGYKLEWLPLPVSVSFFLSWLDIFLYIFSYIIKTALVGRVFLVRQQGIYVLSKMCLHLSFDDLMLGHTLLTLSALTHLRIDVNYDELDSQPRMMSNNA